MHYFKKYNVFQLLYLGLQVIYSKVFICRTVRVIKFPFSIIGQRNIAFNEDFTSGRNLRLECIGEHNRKMLFFGKNVKVNDYVHIACAQKIAIGDNVLIGSNVLITDHNHGKYHGDNQDAPYTIPDERELDGGEVIIGNNAWIGDMVSIMPNVVIGNGSIIGANSVVTTDIPENSIAVGVPCKVIKRYNDETQRWEKV